MAGASSSKPRLPPGLAAGGLLLILAAAIYVPLGYERKIHAGTRSFARTPTTMRDVLTGRRSREDGTPVPPASGWGTADRPIRLCFVPAGDKAQAGAAIDDLVAFLRRRTGYRVEGAILAHYGLVVQQIQLGQCEVAFLTAASYARAWYATSGNDTKSDDVVAVLAAVREGDPSYPGSDLAYRGAIITRVDSDVTRVDQLTSHRTVAMGNRTSGAGSLLPSALLNQLGLSPKIHRVEGYPIIVMSVLQGVADAGCVYWSPPTPERPENDGRRSVLESQPDVFSRTRIIGFTPWIPNEPVVMRATLDPTVRRVMARAIALYAATNAVSAEGRARLESIGGVVGYIPATNEDFAPLLEVVEQAFANDPAGRKDFMAGSK